MFDTFFIALGLKLIHYNLLLNQRYIRNEMVLIGLDHICE